MDTNGTSKTMSIPPAPPPPPPPPPAHVQQPSIRSFFQPRTPNYTPPPNVQASAISIPPPTQSHTSSLPLSSHNNGTPPASSTSSPSLPKQATISPIDASHIQPLRRINSLLLPINYPDSFYHKILDPSTPSFSRIIVWTDSPTTPLKVIGGLVCCLDASLAPDSTPNSPKFLPDTYDVYVQSLVLLSPYRGMGLAAAALNSVIEAATEQIRVKIAGLYAHVWTENEEGLDWYAARGFKKEEPVVQGYYKRLKPDSAWILRRRLGVGDHLAQNAPISKEEVLAPDIHPAGTAVQNSTPPPKALPTQIRPPGATHTASFQDRRPDREWNDLPEDVLGASLLKPPSTSSTRDVSAASSRSSSRSGAGKKKKERLYPPAAFGS